MDDPISANLASQTKPMYPLQEDIKHENPTSFPTISILLHNLKAKDVQGAEDRLIKIVIDHNTNFVASMAM